MADTPNLDQEFQDEDSKAGDPQESNPQRDKFKEAHGDDSPPSREPTGGPPRDDTPPPPESREPLREPTNNPTNSSPNR